MEVKPKDIMEIKIDGKGRVLIPAEKRKELGIEDGDKVELAVLGSN